MSFYNNIICCLNFYKNINYLIQFIDKFNEFTNQSKTLFKNVKRQIQKYKSFDQFHNDLLFHEDNIDTLKSKISTLCCNHEKITKYGLMGNLLESIYEIFYDDNFHNSIMYVIYLDEYMKSMNNVKLILE